MRDNNRNKDDRDLQGQSKGGHSARGISLPQNVPASQTLEIALGRKRPRVVMLLGIDLAHPRRNEKWESCPGWLFLLYNHR